MHAPDQLAPQATGIVSALAEELAAILEQVDVSATMVVGGREFHVGTLGGRSVVLVVSRMGKVAAAATATNLLERFGVGRVLFTGLAGGIGSDVRVGDIVIAEHLVHHDLDARPLFPRYEIPGLGLAHLPTDTRLSDTLYLAASTFAANAPMRLAPFGITRPKVHRGLIASGDQFIASADQVTALRCDLPGVLAVEMEGAAVAQVCYEHGIPFALARVISDDADHHASINFADFLRDACGLYASALVREAMRLWR
jgi:adenosylhomocysteine nucleosidase